MRRQPACSTATTGPPDYRDAVYTPIGTRRIIPACFFWLYYATGDASEAYFEASKKCQRLRNTDFSLPERRHEVTIYNEALARREVPLLDKRK